MDGPPDQGIARRCQENHPDTFSVLFSGQACVTPTNLDARRLAGALYEGGVEMTESNLYLGRFVFTASANAVGTFTIAARVSDTKLFDSADQPLTWSSIPKNVVVTAP